MTRLNSLDPRAPTLSPSAVRVAGLQFHEADSAGNARGAAGTITGSVVVPAYAALLDIVVYAEALWDDGTSAALKIGINGDDDDTFFTAVNLKATDLTADQAISFAFAGGVGGTSLSTATHVLDVLDGADRTIDAIVTLGAGDGTAGKTYVYVVYAVPELDDTTYAAS